VETWLHIIYKVGSHKDNGHGDTTNMARRPSRLGTETVQGAARALESVHNVEGSDGFTLSVLCVGDGVADDVLEEDLEDTAGLLVDEARDTLDTTTTGEAADSGLGDTLDVVTKNLAVTFSTALSEALAAFSASRHECLSVEGWWW